MKNGRITPRVIMVIAIIVLAAIFVSCAAPTPTTTPTATPKSTPTSTAKPAPTQTTVAPKPTPTPQPAVRTYVFGGSAPPSVAYIIHVAASNIVSKNVPGVRMDPMGIPGGQVGALTGLERGEVQFAMSDGTTIKDSLTGTGQFKDKPPAKNVRGWYGFGILVAYEMYVREDSGITNLEGLRRQKFGTGRPGSNTAYQIENSLINILGINIEPAQRSFEDLTDDVRAKRTVGTAKGSYGFALDAVIKELDLTVPMRVLGLTKAEADKINAKSSETGTAAMLQPAGLLRGSPEMYVLTSVGPYAVRADVPEEDVYNITKVLAKNHKMLIDVAPGLKGTDPIEDMKTILRTHPTVPMHPGVIRWLRENGVTVPDSAIPPEMKK